MAESPKALRKPRRWRRRLGILFVLLLALAWFAPTILVRSGLVHSFLAKATAKLDGTIAVGSISLGWFAPVVLTDVTWTGSDGEPLLTAPTVRSSVSLLTLARNPADLGSITIENPTVSVVHLDRTTNLERALGKILDDHSPSSGARPQLVLRIENGTLNVRDADRNWAVKGMDSTVIVPAVRTEAIRVEARGTMDDSVAGTLSADVRLGSGIDVVLKANDVPLDLLAPFARRHEPDFQSTGRLSVELDGRIEREPSVSAKLAGQIALTGIDVCSARLHGERLKLDAVRFPLSIRTTPAGIAIEKAELICDLGRATVSGTLDPNEPMERWVDRADLAANAELDVAKLAAQFPRLFRLRAGTELREGRITASLASASGPKGTTWSGTLGTSALRGTRDGQPLAWEEPLTVAFIARWTPDGMPAFDKLDAKAEFATLSGSGTADNFSLDADVSLDTFSRRFGEFVDLSGLQLAGTLKLAARSRTANRRTTLDGTAAFKNLVVSSGNRSFREPDLTAKWNADGTFFDSKTRRLNAASATVSAGSESAELRLLEPIADMLAPENGRASARFTGDLERWRDRAASFLTLPKAIATIGGRGTITGNITVTPDAFALDSVTADLKDARFTGYGLKLDEPQLLIDPTTGRIDRKTGLVEFPTLMLRSSTVAASVKPLRIVPRNDGEYGVELDGIVNANLARVQQLLKLQSDPQLTDRLDGLVAAGTIKIRTEGTAYTFDANLPVQNFVLGPPHKPTWTEARVAIVAKGSYDDGSDGLQLDHAVVERPDGLKVDATARILRVSTDADLTVSGRISYDLAILEPQLKKFLGPKFQVAGKDTREFRVAGPLFPNVGANTPTADSPFGNLNGNASLAWQSLKAYGFDVGRSQLSARLDRGVVRIEPVEATFGETGKVRLEPTLRFLPTGDELTFARGTVVDRAKLTPAACADALGYVLPAFARASETSGTISFELDTNRIPLAAPEKVALTGRLTLHEVQVGPGPVIAEILQLTGAKTTTFSLNKDNKPQVVNMKVENGWVYHENLTLATKNFTMITSGRVSLDGELDMVADVPLPDSDIGPLLKNNPKIRDALANKRIQLPVRGTIDKPKLDPRAFRTAVRKVTDEIIRDLGKNALGGLLDKIGPPPRK